MTRKLHPAVLRFLAARGVADPIDLLSTPPPSLIPLPGLDEAVAALAAALDGGRPILLFGDYDVDGVAAAVVLAEALEALGGAVEVVLPNRLEEGYGLTSEAVAMAAARGALLVTVDTGVTAVREAAEARALGVPLVITDHHEPGPVLPDAIVVNPKLAPDGPPLAGAGVAWAVASALLGEPFAAGLGLVALGTVADQMPVLGPNRALIRAGLAAGVWAERAGIRALGERLGLDPAAPLSARTVAFRLAPRLNAAGRLGQAEVAYALLRADPADAPAWAERLERLNDERRRLLERMAAAALAKAAPGPGALLLVEDEGPGWHRGLLGVVAARLADACGRPALIGTRQGDRVHGSGRSVPGVDLLAALRQHEALFERLGGHRDAVGFTLPAHHVDELARRLAAWTLPATRPPGPAPDTYLRPDEVEAALLADLADLEPFGAGFPEPVFAMPGVPVAERRPLGQNGGVAFRVLGQAGVAWDGLPASLRLDLLVQPERDLGGRVRLRVVAASPAEDAPLLRRLAACLPYAFPAEVGWAPPAPPPDWAPDTPSVLLVPTLACVEMLAAALALRPLPPDATAAEVAAAVERVEAGWQAGFVVLRPPPALPRWRALQLWPWPPEQATEAMRAGAVDVVRVPYRPPDGPTIADVEQLREVVRRRRRGAEPLAPLVEAFADRVFAEIGLGPDLKGRADLRRSALYRGWSRFEESLRLKLSEGAAPPRPSAATGGGEVPEGWT